MSFSGEEIETLSRAIAHRRSMGLSRLSEDPVPSELIDRMLRAADWAPSHGDTEPWRYIVFADEAREQLAEAYGKAYAADHTGESYDPAGEAGYRERAFKAPVWIAIGMSPAMNEDGSWVMTEMEEMMAVACSVQNLHVMASAQGLAGMWHSKGLSVHPVVASALGWEPPARLLGFFFCGYPNVDWPEGERKPIEGKVSWV
jgi:nitroreductase